MNIEKEIERALARRAGDVDAPEPGTWSGVEHRIRRGRRVRAVATAALAAAAVIVAAVFVPRVFNDRRTGLAGPGPGLASKPSPSPREVPASSQPLYRDDDAGWMMNYDASWHPSTFEGVTDFVPKSLKSPNVGEPTAAISIQLLHEQYDANGGEAMMIAGANARKITSHDRVTYRVDWGAVRCGPNAMCWPQTLQASVVTNNQQLRAQYQEKMMTTVEQSLRAATFDGSSSALVTTQYGTVQAGVRYDKLTSRLVAFLSARVGQAGAEPFMSENARRQFNDPKRELGLYAERNSPSTSWQTFDVDTRKNKSVDSAEYVLTVEWSNGRGYIRGERETITVARSGSTILIVDAEIMNFIEEVP